MLIIKNLSLESPPNWKPFNNATCTTIASPGARQPAVGRTLNFSGDVVFICQRSWGISVDRALDRRLTLYDMICDACLLCSSRELVSSFPSRTKTKASGGFTTSRLPSKNKILISKRYHLKMQRKILFRSLKLVLVLAAVQNRMWVFFKHLNR